MEVSRIGTSIVCLIVLLFLQTCSSDPGITPRPRIVHGQDAPRGLFTWSAQLHNDDGYTCGGALVSPNHVITAKHCVSISKYRRGLKVVLGDYQRSVTEGTEQEIAVTNIELHRHMDMAILTLNESAVLNENVTIIKMDHVNLPVGTDVIASGWGLTVGIDKTSGSDILQFVETKTVSFEECYGEFPEITRLKGVACIGVKGRTYSNTCHGDSGGPVVYSADDGRGYMLAGTVSSGHTDCPENQHYALINRVNKFISWVYDTAGCDIPGSWSHWYNDRHPTKKRTGDFERWRCIEPRPCGGRKPLCAECLPMRTGACTKLSTHCAKTQKYKCNWAGLQCYGNKQSFRKNSETERCPCCDYKVRFKCPL